MLVNLPMQSHQSLMSILNNASKYTTNPFKYMNQLNSKYKL